jgi:hypothetical protein
MRSVIACSFRVESSSWLTVSAWTLRRVNAACANTSGRASTRPRAGLQHDDPARPALDLRRRDPVIDPPLNPVQRERHDVMRRAVFDAEMLVVVA